MVGRVAYMESINLIEIGPMVIDIRRIENSELAVPVNNAHLCATPLSMPLTHDRVS